MEGIKRSILDLVSFHDLMVWGDVLRVRYELCVALRGSGVDLWMMCRASDLAGMQNRGEVIGALRLASSLAGYSAAGLVRMELRVESGGESGGDFDIDLCERVGEGFGYGGGAGYYGGGFPGACGGVGGGFVGVGAGVRYTSSGKPIVIDPSTVVSDWSKGMKSLFG